MENAFEILWSPKLYDVPIYKITNVHAIKVQENMLLKVV